MENPQQINRRTWLARVAWGSFAVWSELNFGLGRKGWGVAIGGRDLAIESDEGVHFERAWLDPEAGRVFCLATGPSKEAVMRIHERAGHPTGEVYELTVEVA